MREMIGGCCVCSDDSGWSENPLVYCDGQACTVAVHQACYGIVTVPTGPWFCRKCESSDRLVKVKCELCPSKYGALKKTDTEAWAHVVCALYIPEVRFGNVTTMEPILLQLIPAERFNKVCYICEEKGKISNATVGACMQCNKTGCKQQFHVTCAQSLGLLCEEAGNYFDNVKYCGYCQYHYSKLKKGGNVKTIPPYKPVADENYLSDSGSDKESSNSADSTPTTSIGDSSATTTNTSSMALNRRRNRSGTKNSSTKSHLGTVNSNQKQSGTATNTAVANNNNNNNNNRTTATTNSTNAGGTTTKAGVTASSRKRPSPAVTPMSSAGSPRDISSNELSLADGTANGPTIYNNHQQRSMLQSDSTRSTLFVDQKNISNECMDSADTSTTDSSLSNNSSVAESTSRQSRKHKSTGSINPTCTDKGPNFDRSNSLPPDDAHFNGHSDKLFGVSNPLASNERIKKAKLEPITQSMLNNQPVVALTSLTSLKCNAVPTDQLTETLTANRGSPCANTTTPTTVRTTPPILGTASLVVSVPLASANLSHHGTMHLKTQHHSNHDAMSSIQNTADLDESSISSSSCSSNKTILNFNKSSIINHVKEDATTCKKPKLDAEESNLDLSNLECKEEKNEGEEEEKMDSKDGIELEKYTETTSPSENPPKSVQPKERITRRKRNVVLNNQLATGSPPTATMPYQSEGDLKRAITTASGTTTALPAPPSQRRHSMDSAQQQIQLKESPVSSPTNVMAFTSTSTNPYTQPSIAPVVNSRGRPRGRKKNTNSTGGGGGGSTTVSASDATSPPSSASILTPVLDPIESSPFHVHDVKISENGSTAAHMLGNQLNPTSYMAPKMTEHLNAEVEDHSTFNIHDNNRIPLVGPQLYQQHRRAVHVQNVNAFSGGYSSASNSSMSSTTYNSNSAIPQTLDQLLERQWEQGSQFLMEQAQHFDIASLLSCLHQLRAENLQLEEHVTHLIQRRDHLLAVNARLAIPLIGQQMVAGMCSPGVHFSQSPPAVAHRLSPAAGSNSDNSTASTQSSNNSGSNNSSKNHKQSDNSNHS